jgi:GAF domain-containing protein
LADAEHRLPMPDDLVPSVPPAPPAGLSDTEGELVGTIQRLSLARSVLDVQELVRSAARRLTGADGATFVLREDDLCHYVDEDAISPLWKGQRFPLSACISGWAMLNRHGVAIADIYSDDRIPHDAYRQTFVKSLAMVPIRQLDPLGAIGNYWADHHEPSQRELALLQALADSTAVAL